MKVERERESWVFISAYGPGSQKSEEIERKEKEKMFIQMKNI